MSSLSFTHQTLKSGKILEYSESVKTEYRHVAIELLEALFREFAKGSRRLHDPELNIEDPPYKYSERCFDSVVLPVLHRLCDGLVLAEYPMQRKGREITGHVDYWCLYKEYSFLIEMKKSDCSLGAVIDEEIVSDRMLRRWRVMCNQLESLEDDAKEFVEKAKGIVPIGLHFVTVKSRADKWNQTEQQLTKSCKETMQAFANVLSGPYKKNRKTRIHKPNYVASWIIPVEARRCWDEEDLYPFVMLFGRINPLIQHKGPDRR